MKIQMEESMESYKSEQMSIGDTVILITVKRSWLGGKTVKYKRGKILYNICEGRYPLLIELEDKSTVYTRYDETILSIPINIYSKSQKKKKRGLIEELLRPGDVILISIPGREIIGELGRINGDNIILSGKSVVTDYEDDYVGSREGSFEFLDETYYKEIQISDIKSLYLNDKEELEWLRLKN